MRSAEPLCFRHLQLSDGFRSQASPLTLDDISDRSMRIFSLDSRLVLNETVCVRRAFPDETVKEGGVMRERIFLSGLLAIVATAMSGAPVKSYEVGAVTGGGTIEGTVFYRGAVPTKKIIPTKDVEVCGAPRDDPLIRVGADQAVESAVVYLVEVAKGKAWPEPGKPPELNNVKCRFEPEVQVIPAGPLEVVNSDPVLHNTHGFYGKRTAFNLALPIEGQRIPVELPRSGTVRVDCDAHGWMEGWIYVADNPYYAVTGADGKFSITDVPPGDYTLVAVQPLTGPIEQPVTVTEGQSTSLEIEVKK
jgi:Carboxypeptidase regulatory-like domain